MRKYEKNGKLYLQVRKREKKEEKNEGDAW